MSTRFLRLLYVEDDVVQRRLVEKHLRSMEEFGFEIIFASGQDEALARFDRSGIDVVLLDYQLTQGTGLSCLEQIRSRDQLAPVICLSAQATPEIGAELLQAGADDYLVKSLLRRDNLARSLRLALARADARRKLAGQKVDRISLIDTELRQACRLFLKLFSGELQQRLSIIVTESNQLGMSCEQVEMLFDQVVRDLSMDEEAGSTILDRKLALRPLLLELRARMPGPTLADPSI